MTREGRVERRNGRVGISLKFVCARGRHCKVYGTRTQRRERLFRKRNLKEVKWEGLGGVHGPEGLLEETYGTGLRLVQSV